MITSYTYKIVSTNPSMGAMEVEFSAPDMPTVLVGARMPYVGEALSDLIQSVAPIAHWESLTKQVADVEVGHAGELTVPQQQPSVPTFTSFSPSNPQTSAAQQTPLQFLSLFTQEEQLGITAASLQSPQVRLWYDQLIAATEVVNTDPRVSAGLDALVAAGLLTQERRDVILPPSSGLTPA